jgi:hypothetical protein
VTALTDGGDELMGVLLAVLLIVLLLGGLGFAVHFLWILAVIALVLWLVGFVVRGAEGSRWYRW